MAGKTVVVAVDEGGSVNVYGPFSREKAEKVADKIDIDSTGDTNTFITELESDYQEEEGGEWFEIYGGETVS